MTEGSWSNGKPCICVYVSYSLGLAAEVERVLRGLSFAGSEGNFSSYLATQFLAWFTRDSTQ